MALLTGLLLAQPSYGDGNAHLASLPAITPWINPGPISALAGAVNSAGTLVRADALAHPRALAGELLTSYFNDFYYRVHISPSRIDLGNLVTAQSRPIDVWNAWPDLALSMTDLLIAGGDGITVTGDNTRPLPFAPLQQRTWDIAVTVDGPPVIDAQVSWVFVGEPSVVLAITSKRLTAWMLAPNWTDGVKESLEWNTDIQQADNGIQLREPLRESPRRDWQFGVVADGRDRRVLESAIFDWGARTWAMPVWPDVTWLASPLASGSSTITMDTRDLDYVVGGLAMIYRNTTQFELVEISDVADAMLTLTNPTVQAWANGDRIYPCRLARLADTPMVSRMNDDVMVASIRMRAAEACDWLAVAPVETYLAVPVLDLPDDWSNARDTGYARQLDVTDNAIGLIDVLDRSGHAWITLPRDWVLNGKSDRAAHRSLMYWLQGRAQALWIPSGASDLTLASTLGATSTALVVGRAGVTQFQRQQPGRRHLRIALADGSVFYRRVVSSIETGDTEQLQLDTDLGMDVSPSQVLMISWMMLCTLASDTVEIQHITDSAGVARCGVRFAAVPAEEP